MRYVLISLFLYGCVDAVAREQFQRCRTICSYPAGNCNNFNLEDCVSYCTGLASTEEVDAYEACADCYVAVWCDARGFQSICYPGCGGGL